ncbi:MAG: hypothetical protein E6J41_16040 [Chloroflexi bacterium]|nr:MAG: hypothetical protein E6J41_16040 [Chloroflexota bacterium]
MQTNTMSSSHVVEWDERNLAHLLAGDVSPSEVDEVLHSPTSMRRRIAGNRRKYHGRTHAGRRLNVIVDVLGPNHVRPRTARDVPRR